MGSLKQHGVNQKDSDFSEEFWKQVYEHETNGGYFFEEPVSPDQVRMFVSVDGKPGTEPACGARPKKTRFFGISANESARREITA
jgi:hypothetical protein